MTQSLALNEKTRACIKTTSKLITGIDKHANLTNIYFSD